MFSITNFKINLLLEINANHWVMRSIPAYALNLLLFQYVGLFNLDNSLIVCDLIATLAERHLALAGAKNDGDSSISIYHGWRD